MKEIKKFKICIFGDSIAYGWFDFKKMGWVYRLREVLEKKGDYRIFNLSIPGDTTQDLLKRFKNESVVREPDMIMFAVGINDSQFYFKENKFKVNSFIFEKNVSKLITLAKNLTEKIVFIGLIPVDEKLITPLPKDPERILKNEFIERYNRIIKNVCKNEKVKFIDLFNKWKKINYKKFLFDGLHPNEKGHEEIFKIIYRSLKF